MALCAEALLRTYGSRVLQLPVVPLPQTGRMRLQVHGCELHEAAASCRQLTCRGFAADMTKTFLKL